MTQIDKISRVLGQQPAPAPAQAGDDWLDVQALYRIIRRRIGLIAVVAMLVMAVALPLILNMSPVFSASARVLIQEPLPATLSASRLASETDLNLNTESERLLSRDIAVRVIRDLDLEAMAEFNPELRTPSLVTRLKDGLRALFVGKQDRTASTASPIDYVLPEFLSHLRIWRSPGSDVVNIDFTSQDPQLAATVPNTLVRVYLAQRAGQFAARIATAEAWLQGRIEDQKQRLARAVAAADAAKEDTEELLSGAFGTAEVIAKLGDTRTGVVRSKAELTASLSALRNAVGLEAKAEAVDTEVVTGLRRDLETERANLARLLDRYGAAHEQVVVSQDQVSDLEDRIAAELAREERRLQSRLTVLDQEEARIGHSLSDAQSSFAELRQAEDRIGRLQRVMDNERAALDGLEKQLRDLKAEARLPATEVEVLSPASVPLAADGRGRVYFLAVALFAAIALALTAAFLVEMLDKTVRSHDQLQDIPGVRWAGLVPELPAGAMARFWSAFPQDLSRAHHDAIQGILLMLERTGNGTPPQSILITSALPGEGKTTLAAALAAELAASGRPALLVDADLRHGGLSRRFGRQDGPGFSDYLTGDVSLADLARHDLAPDLSLVARGSSVSHRSFNRALVKSLIRLAHSENRTVVFDAAPALVANEALLLAGMVDRTILAIRWGRTDRGAVEAAVDRLSAGNDVDVVMGRVNLRRQALYGYRDAGILAQSLDRYYARLDR